LAKHATKQTFAPLSSNDSFAILWISLLTSTKKRQNRTLRHSGIFIHTYDFIEKR